MGLLIDIRENWRTFLLNDLKSGAAAYFKAEPAIPIFTEKLKTIEAAVTDSLTKIGLSVVIVTVVAKNAENQIQGLYFGDIIACARILENPKANRTNVPCSDAAEAVAWFTRSYRPDDSPMKLDSIRLGTDPKRLSYDVLYTIEAGIVTPPQRPSLIATDEQGDVIMTAPGE